MPHIRSAGTAACLAEMLHVNHRHLGAEALATGAEALAYICDTEDFVTYRVSSEDDAKDERKKSGSTYALDGSKQAAAAAAGGDSHPVACTYSSSTRTNGHLCFVVEPLLPRDQTGRRKSHLKPKAVFVFRVLHTPTFFLHRHNNRND